MKRARQLTASSRSWPSADLLPGVGVMMAALRKGTSRRCSWDRKEEMAYLREGRDERSAVKGFRVPLEVGWEDWMALEAVLKEEGLRAPM